MNKESLLIHPQASPKVHAQLEKFNLDLLKTLAEEYVLNKPVFSTPKNIEPVKTYSRNPKKGDTELYKKAEKLGRELVRQGKVGAFLVAGGQGTRLGFNGPKGEFLVTPIKHKSLFQVFAEQLRAYSKENYTSIPWYIMTSDINDAETKAFFAKHNYFGYHKKDVFFFEQGMMPAFAMDGSLLLANKNSLVLSPDGHGGSLQALEKSGALADMKRRGIEYLSYFQVDNPLVHCIDYTFIGLHALTGSEMSSKVVPKVDALERVGNFVMADGKVQVIEYSDIPKELAEQKNADGSLTYNAGSIAIHALNVSFIDRLIVAGELKLPWHRAEKKVACIDQAGNPVKPETPNAVKLEQFIFDAIPLAKNALVYETDRAEEFSPVKNAEGSDSPKTSIAHQIARASRWLQEAGIHVPSGHMALEIDPLFATSSEQFRTKVRSFHLSSIPANANVYFGSFGIEGLTPSIQIASPSFTKRVILRIKNMFGFGKKTAEVIKENAEKLAVPGEQTSAQAA
jgi:UDP-N-acetylglucosamine/UDP-N-acetylgalactosamine diphosphorylase